MEEAMKSTDLLPFPDRFAEQVGELADYPTVSGVAPTVAHSFLTAGGVILTMRDRSGQSVQE